MSNKKILIVDDDADVLFTLEERLTREGFDVVTAENGLLAITMAKSHRPDLVLLDVQMSGMDGGEVAQRLKADSATKEIPIVFLTCLLARQESSQVEHHSGGNLMLSKSMESAELVSLIHKMLHCVC